MAFLSQTIRRTIRSGESQPTGFGLVLFILMQEISVDSEIVQGPSNTTAKVNESTYFNCSTSIRPVDKNVIWFHFALDEGGDRRYVYDDGRFWPNYKNRFDIEIDKSTGEFNLLIKRLEMKDAGMYDCRDDSHADIGASANLTVLGSDLVCESDMNPRGVVGPTECERAIVPDVVTLSCSLTYNGADAPEMVWSRAGDSSTLNNTRCVNIDKRVTCNTTLTANLQLIGSAYICEVTAQQYNCSLEINNILYAFANVTKREYYTGTNVTCIANASGKEACLYTWYKDNTTEVSSHPTFTPNDPGSYKCQAQCPIRADSCNFTAMLINVSTVPFTDTVSDPGPNYLLHEVLWPILIVVLGAVLLLVIILYRRGLIKWPRPTADPLLSDQEATSSGTPAMELKNVIKMESYKRNEEEKIKTHRNLLEEILDPDSGLLDALLANKALSQAEKSQVDDRDPYSKRNCQLLDYIIENRQGHQFIATLQNSEQRHIANFLTANGKYNQEYGGEWPLTNKEIPVFVDRPKRKVFIDLLKSYKFSDLPSRLYFSKVINKRQMKLASCREADVFKRSSKAEVLLDFLRRRSIRDYWQTMRFILKRNLTSKERTDIEEILKTKEGDESEIPQFDIRSPIDNPSARYNYYPEIDEEIDIEGKMITGLTVLGEELFIVCERSPMVEVYNVATYSFIHQWEIEVADPGGIESCKSNQCLYIVGFEITGSLKTILRVTTLGKVIDKWRVADSWSSLSVTQDSNVILTVQKRNKIIEYSPEGQEIRKIELASASHIAINNLWHSVELGSNSFVVCCGLEDDDNHRVFTVDERGTRHRIFSQSNDPNIAKLNQPFYLVVDNDGFILVADRKNHRVLLFNPMLECQRELLYYENNELRFPSVLYLDESRRLLYVAESDRSKNNGRVSIFRLSSL